MQSWELLPLVRLLFASCSDLEENLIPSVEIDAFQVRTYFPALLQSPAEGELNGKRVFSRKAAEQGT
jgi:hypothetical protein